MIYTYKVVEMRTRLTGVGPTPTTVQYRSGPFYSGPFYSAGLPSDRVSLIIAKKY